MPHWSCRLVVAAMVAVAGLPMAPALRAQDQPPVFRSRSTLVEVDVAVRDGRGRFVRDLRVEDFEVLDDGAPQQIATAYRVLGPADGGIDSQLSYLPAPPSEGTLRVVALLFDLGHLKQASLYRARQAALGFLRDGFRDGDVGGVVAGDRLVNNRFTDSRRELEEAVLGLGNESRDASTADDLSRGEVRSTAFANWTSRMTLDAIRSLCDGLAGLPGRKTVILLSDGFTFSEKLYAELWDTGARGSLASVRIYAIDTRGLNKGTAGSDIFTSSASEPTAVDPTSARYNRPASSSGDPANDALSSLASDTGGYVIRNQNDLGKALAEIDRATSSYYILGFTPTRRLDGRYHRLSVRVKRGGVTVRARKGYVASAEASPKPPEAASPDRKDAPAGPPVSPILPVVPAAAAPATMPAPSARPAGPPPVPAKARVGPAPGSPRSVYLDLADAYQRRGEFGNAIDVLREALSRWPRDVEIYSALGVIQLARGAVNDAITTFTKAVSVDPKNANACYNLAKTYEVRYVRSERLRKETPGSGAGATPPDDRTQAVAYYERVVTLGGPLVEQAKEGLRRLGR